MRAMLLRVYNQGLSETEVIETERVPVPECRQWIADFDASSARSSTTSASASRGVSGSKNEEALRALLQDHFSREQVSRALCGGQGVRDPKPRLVDRTRFLASLYQLQHKGRLYRDESCRAVQEHVASKQEVENYWETQNREVAQENLALLNGLNYVSSTKGSATAFLQVERLTSPEKDLARAHEILELALERENLRREVAQAAGHSKVPSRRALGGGGRKGGMGRLLRMNVEGRRVASGGGTNTLYSRRRGLRSHQHLGNQHATNLQRVFSSQKLVNDMSVISDEFLKRKKVTSDDVEARLRNKNIASKTWRAAQRRAFEASVGEFDDFASKFVGGGASGKKKIKGEVEDNDLKAEEVDVATPSSYTPSAQSPTGAAIATSAAAGSESRPLALKALAARGHDFAARHHWHQPLSLEAFARKLSESVLSADAGTSTEADGGQHESRRSPTTTTSASWSLGAAADATGQEPVVEIHRARAPEQVEAPGATIDLAALERRARERLTKEQQRSGKILATAVAETHTRLEAATANYEQRSDAIIAAARERAAERHRRLQERERTLSKEAVLDGLVAQSAPLSEKQFASLPLSLQKQRLTREAAQDEAEPADADLCVDLGLLTTHTELLFANKSLRAKLAKRAAAKRVHAQRGAAGSK
eukprot:g7152.t1